MEYAAFVFGIFGLLAYLQVSPLKRRIDRLEEQLAHTEGTPHYEERTALFEAARSYIGRQVMLELKEDQEDADILLYGNSKRGSNTILDTDGEWMLVRVASPKGEKDKLIRLASVERISVLS